MEKPSRKTHTYRNKYDAESPSFSSTLLDAIYRSIDDNHDHEEKLVFYKQSIKTKYHYNTTTTPKNTHEFQDTRKMYHQRHNSSSISSDSGLFSSSEGEFSFRPAKIQTKKLDETLNYVKTRDLKKVKQPISPGGKVASFLNSLFTQKKNSKSKSKSKSCDTSTCSSASSFSRSCLSKTPSSKGKSTNTIKRSIRLYAEEDKHIIEKSQIMKKSNYEDDDCDSCASSDLFELDNLSPICIQRYREELPVYGTTHLDKNRAIARGFIM